MKQFFILAHDRARRGAVQAVQDAPPGWRVTIDEPRRSGEQNAALHARIGEIAARMTWAGQKHDADTWKRLLVGAWCRANKEPVLMLPALDGQGVEIVFRHTSTLTRAECSSLLDYVESWCAEQPAMHEPTASAQ